MTTFAFKDARHTSLLNDYDVGKQLGTYEYFCFLQISTQNLLEENFQL